MSNLLKKAYRNTGAQSNAGKIQSLLAKGLKLHQAGDFGQAASAYGQILEIEPNNFDALHLLGMTAHQTGNSADAIILIDRAIQIRSDVADAWVNRSTILMDLARYHEAFISCEQAIELDQNNADAWFNAGNALAKLEERGHAVSHYLKALAISPNFAQCWVNLGGEYLESQNYEASQHALNQAIKLDPQNLKAWLNLGVIYQELGELGKAREAYETTLALNPRYTKALTNLANLSFEDGRAERAAELAQVALTISPTNPEANNVLGNYFRVMGLPTEASTSFRAALEHDPGARGFHSNLILSLLADPFVSQDSILDEALRYGARHASQTVARTRSRADIQRIGFVSGDLRVHPVGFFVEPLFEGLQGVEVYIYANQKVNDAQTERLKSHASAWRNVLGMPARQIADTIRNDEIDVLVDLSGHTSDGLLNVFALNPAPVQVSWLGFSGTTGISQFDALFGDKIVTPRTHDSAYSEPIARLRHGFAPLPTTFTDRPVAPTPAIKNGFVTFGSFNATTKINDEVVAAWSRILQSTPDSRMILKNLYFGDAGVQARFAQAFLANGVDLQRIEMRGQCNRDEHWQSFDEIDISLDTFPYSGATTTVDNLWMGVPVVTLFGDRYCGRMSASFLTTVGLDQWIAPDVEEYVQLATTFAQDISRLEKIRSSLRQRYLDSPLAQPEMFAADFLEAITKLWTSSGARAA